MNAEIERVANQVAIAREKYSLRYDERFRYTGTDEVLRMKLSIMETDALNELIEVKNKLEKMVREQQR